MLGIVAFSLTVASTTASAQMENVLHSFDTGKRGYFPAAGVISDRSGNLYGTTTVGGEYGGGLVFELMPGKDGSWTQRILHTFGANVADGYAPQAKLVFDPSGNLYGTTNSGGSMNFGTVFELSPSVGGGWTETVLHSFDQTDGANPRGALILDNAGNIYGTTAAGGNGIDCVNCGEVFELVRGTGGRWAERSLHAFSAEGGLLPSCALAFDAAGNLYGTTEGGGAFNSGTVFKLTPKNGQWTETVLHSFKQSATDGNTPFAGVILDAAGNLYGTTYYGGLYASGTAFELTPGSDGNWTETVLHDFGAAGDGIGPQYGGLIIDTAGNLYGTTGYGGAGFGTVFELTLAEAGTWSENLLLAFTGENGDDPTGGLDFDEQGNLYGTTFYGGIYSDGTVFEITP